MAQRIRKKKGRKLNLNIPQSQFMNSKKPFKAFVGGYRSGKTFVLCIEACIKATMWPEIEQAYFAPTIPLIKTIFWPTIAEVAPFFGFEVVIKSSDKEVYLMKNNRVYSKIICRSMDNPAAIVGFQVNHALIDEIDTMNKLKAADAWNKIVARLSSDGFEEDELELYTIPAYITNTASFSTTPEGFAFCYDFFVKQVREDPEKQKYYDLIKASTLQNAKNLPDDYIDKLYATYPAHLVEAYVNGEFVNLTSGSVYTAFDRKKNNTKEVEDGKEDLHIGIDFNVDEMASVVHVIRKDKKGGDAAYAVDEFYGNANTQDLCDSINDRYEGRKIYVYPDASGRARKTSNKSASETDLKLLKDAGFTVIVDRKNPGVRDRINSMNAAFCNAKKEIRYYVNTKKCKRYTECLEQQVYKNGEPDKSSGTDHMNDAGGYFIAKKFPAIKPRQRTAYKNISMV